MKYVCVQGAEQIINDKKNCLSNGQCAQGGLFRNNLTLSLSIKQQKKGKV